MMAVTVSSCLVAWGPFTVLCVWEILVQPKVETVKLFKCTSYHYTSLHLHQLDLLGIANYIVFVTWSCNICAILIMCIMQARNKSGCTSTTTTTTSPLQDIPASFRLLANLFAKSATAVNPFIYFFMSRGFRSDTVNLLLR